MADGVEPAAGPWDFRAAARQSTLYGAANSTPVKVTIEDVKAAGAYYLKHVAVVNSAGFALDDMVKAFGLGNASYVDLQQSTRSYAAAERAWVQALDAYANWPHAVQPLVASLMAANTNDYNLMDQAASAPDASSFTAIYNTSYGDESDAEQIREKLGLPVVPVGG